MTRRVVLAATLLMGVVFSPAAAQTGIDFGATRERNLDSNNVTITITNHTNDRIELFRGNVRDVRDGHREARLRPEVRYLRPGEQHSWEWIHEGDAGRFKATLHTSAGTLRDIFDVGAYFTINFRCNDTPENPCYDPFVIWVREDRPIRQLRADLAEPQEGRRIVSGIVRRAKPYNAHWSYTMGPASIVLGEVFIEVCDANPQYVEENRREWMGERWCPWSSYVESEGR
ncbi:MAG: hypothetical protein M3161_03020 [Actinomycetota bacterium]|nr:hypothetical protein [Actinomycetota bacterium]